MCCFASPALAQPAASWCHFDTVFEKRRPWKYHRSRSAFPFTSIEQCVHRTRCLIERLRRGIAFDPLALDVAHHRLPGKDRPTPCPLWTKEVHPLHKFPLVDHPSDALWAPRREFGQLIDIQVSAHP